MASGGAGRGEATAPAPAGASGAGTVRGGGSRRWPPTLGVLAGAACGLWGLALGLQPLRDNSFFTHLATGRLILAGGVPRSDPYTFTAAGTPWVVQSWLASWVYAAVERLSGAAGLLVLNGVLMGALAVGVWWLTAPARGLAVRLGLAALALGVATGAWSERPLLFGFGCLILALVSADGRVDPRWCVPVFAVWVNVHGSFPLGLAALGLLAVGAALDRRFPAAEAGSLVWAVVGVVLGGLLSVVGPRLWWFPVELLARGNVLGTIVEWAAPSFTSTTQRLFLLQVAVVVAVLAWRPSWRLAVPTLVLVPAALVSARTIAVTSLVLTAAAAPALAGVGGLAARRRSPVAAVGVLAVAGLAVVLTVTAASGPAFDTTAYPQRALAWLEATGRPERLVAPDFVGNYRELLDGARGDVFVDDRYDMFPDAVAADGLTLVEGRPGWDAVLDRWDADAVLWQHTSPLGAVLAAHGAWRVTYDDGEWLVAVRR